MAQRILLPKLLFYQKPVVTALEDDKTKFITFLASRRIGKSLIAKSMAIRWCLSKRCNVGFVVPTGGLARTFIKNLNTLLEGSGAIIGSNSVDKFISFANGSLLYFHTIEAFSRGAGNYKYMIFDECAFLDTETYQTVFQPMTMEADKVYFCSTPNGIGGTFYDMYNKGKTGDKRYKSFECTLEESGLYDKETVKEIKDTTPEAIWLQEYCCKFVAGGISCFKNYEERIKEPAERTKHLYAGIDFSGATGGTDSTVLTIVNDRAETVAVHTYQYGNTKTLKEMAELLNLYNVKMCFAEENSLGSVSIDIMRKDFKKITGFITSNQSKRDIVENVIRNFEQGKGSILNTPQVKTQFGAFIMDYTKGGKITYHNLNSNCHDDLVISYCLASWAVKSYSKKGNYTIS